VYKGKALVNSVTGEEERLEAVLPLIKKYGAAVIGDLQRRDRHFRRPGRALRGGPQDRRTGHADHGIPREDVLIDPLVMPIGAINTAGRQVIAPRPTPARRAGGQHHLRREQRLVWPAQPRPVNAAFLAMAIGAGLTSAITNPLETEIKQAIMAADVMMGHDENCAAWIQATRGPAAGNDRTERRRRARG
jgi:5-methyltetrahydrofolate--homocysteine methyltransferase